MIRRCYCSNTQKIQTSYINCYVDEKWHNFQNFCEWCEINYVIGFPLDKDILIKGNKIYSEKTCCFVPREINNLFCKVNKLRGNLPIGISLNNNKTKFHAQLRVNKQNIHLGFYLSINDAFLAYKKAKEKHIQETADFFKNKISNKVFEALYNYKVEITD
jgi:hypothetical protein